MVYGDFLLWIMVHLPPAERARRLMEFSLILIGGWLCFLAGILVARHDRRELNFYRRSAGEWFTRYRSVCDYASEHYLSGDDE